MKQVKKYFPKNFPADLTRLTGLVPSWRMPSWPLWNFRALSNGIRIPINSGLNEAYDLYTHFLGGFSKSRK